MMREIMSIMPRGRSGYTISCGERPGEHLAHIWQPTWRQVAVIGDSNTAPLYCGSIVRALEPLVDTVVELSFPAGEEHKTRATKELLEDRLLREGLERSACLVAVGGGVTLDLVGFVAATYLRGIDHVNVATSLLAQVDASIGGKTGVNTAAGKNLIGAFHQPRHVLIALDALETLPVEEHRNGLAECVKHAVIGDETLFDELGQWAAGTGSTLPEPLVVKCISIKAKIVEHDEREAGLRQVLNFGHTAGHAIERASEYSVSHGSAVACGMVIEACLAARLLDFPWDDVHRIAQLLATIGLDPRPPVSFEEVSPNLALDKKTRGRRVHCALPRAIGRMEEADGRWSLPVELDDMMAAWKLASEM